MERITAMVDPALAELAKLVEQADSDSVKLAAIKDVLDRAGFAAKQRIEQSGGVRIEVEYRDGTSITLPDHPALPAPTPFGANGNQA